MNDKSDPTHVTCHHTKLYFGSGDFYVICQECQQFWVALKPGRVNDGEIDINRYGYIMDGKPREVINDN